MAFRSFGSKLVSALALAVLLVPVAEAAVAVRLKDISRVQEVRPNRLRGPSLVVGLNGTGDNQKLANQLIGNMLQRMRITISADDLTSKNAAVVMVTAEVPPFMAEGSKFDVLVSCVGDAKSLEGGTLLQAVLLGDDNLSYAVAEGPVSTGAFSVSGEAASVRKNHPTVGRIPGGAILEKAIPTVLRPTDDIHIVLNSPDYTTAVRASAAIAALFPEAAKAVNAGLIQVAVPREYRSVEGISAFIARLDEIKVVPDNPARVVVNERTGTIVAGENVKLNAVAISHGNLTISIKESTTTSQPSPFSSGETRTEKSTDISAQEQKAGLYVMEDSTTLAEVARALNLLGVTPRDMVAIFQALKQAGALQCELLII